MNSKTKEALKELEAWMRKWDVNLLSACYSQCLAVEIEGEERIFLEEEITADDIKRVLEDEK